MHLQSSKNRHSLPQLLTIRMLFLIQEFQHWYQVYLQETIIILSKEIWQIILWGTAFIQMPWWDMMPRGLITGKWILKLIISTSDTESEFITKNKLHIVISCLNLSLCMGCDLQKLCNFSFKLPALLYKFSHYFSAGYEMLFQLFLKCVAYQTITYTLVCICKLSSVPSIIYLQFPIYS